MEIEHVIEKINFFRSKADNSVKRGDIVGVIGAITIYASLTDFHIIQTYRLLEQVKLKGFIVNGLENIHKPSEDIFFYKERISSRRILKEIKKILPFSIHEKYDFKGDIDKYNKKVNDYIEVTNKFLDYRNVLIHHLGNSQITKDDIDDIIKKNLDKYYEMTSIHTEIFQLFGEFSFSENEISYYTKKLNK